MNSINFERELEMKVVVPILLAAAIVIFAIGLLVGKLFFWEDYETTEPIQKDIVAYEKMVQEEPKDEILLVELGWLYYKDGDLQKARETLARALKIDDNNVKAHYNMGLVLQELKMYPEAELEFKKVLNLDKDNIYANHRIGRVYIDQKRWDDAIKQFEISSEIDPASADNFYFWGLALENKGFVDEAKAAYDAALKRVPDYKEAKEALVRLNSLK